MEELNWEKVAARGERLEVTQLKKIERDGDLEGAWGVASEPVLSYLLDAHFYSFLFCFCTPLPALTSESIHCVRTTVKLTSYS